MCKEMFKNFTSIAFCGICCCAIISGCSSTPDESISAKDSTHYATDNFVANGFVSIDEFCRAKLVHIAAHTNKSVPLEGSCYIEDNSMTPVVEIILKRALKAHNLQISSDKNTASYILSVSFDQQYIRRRTYTTLKLVFSENKRDNPVLWTGAASVSGRGNYSVSLYAASMTGAVMYNFNQFATTNVNRRTLQSYYQRLASIGD